MGTTQLLWKTCSSVWAPLEQKMFLLSYLPIDSFPFIGYYWKESGSLFSGLDSPSSFSHPFEAGHFNPLVISSTLWWTAAPVCPCLSCTGGPRMGHSTPDVPYQYWAEGKDHLPQSAGNAFPNRDCWLSSLHGHIAGSCSAHCLSGLPGPFLTSSFTAVRSSAYIGAGTYSSQGTGLYISLYKSLVHPFLQPVKTTPPSFISFANLQEVHSAPSSKLLMRALNSISPSISS